jgi:hypothetical protein
MDVLPIARTGGWRPGGRRPGDGEAARVFSACSRTRSGGRGVRDAPPGSGVLWKSVFRVRLAGVHSTALRQSVFRVAVSRVTCHVSPALAALPDSARFSRLACMIATAQGPVE